jgi:hypothetical protein
LYESVYFVQTKSNSWFLVVAATLAVAILNVVTARVTTTPILY